MSGEPLAGELTAALRLLPGVQEVYPPGRALLPAIPGLPAAVGAPARDAVSLRSRDGGQQVEASIGVAGATGAVATGLDAVRLLRGSVAAVPGAGPVQVRVRIASVD